MLNAKESRMLMCWLYCMRNKRRYSSRTKASLRQQINKTVIKITKS